MELYFLYPILILANIWDLKKMKVPNFITFPGMLIGIVYSIFHLGFSFGIVQSLFGIFLTFLIFLPAWLFFGMGAGDIKLLMVIGAFMGWQVTFHIGFISWIIGMVFFIFLIGIKRTIKMIADFFYLLFYKIPILSAGTKKKLQFAPAILVAFIIQIHFL